jgi:glycosyltransferase involved in cell wall biosynthesis
MRDPDVSVVTAVLNSAHTLVGCLNSVARQQGILVEHIVIDGGSTDGSFKVLEENSRDGLSWTSGPDSGIADAMNKGVERASGRWLYFLQADDRLIDQTTLSSLIHCEGDPDLIAAGIRFGKRTLLNIPSGNKSTVWPKTSPFKQPFRHQGLLISRSAWESVGTYDTSYGITMDFDWLLRAYWKRLRVLRIGLELAQVGIGGISSETSGKLFLKRLQEEQSARIKNAPSSGWEFVYHLFWLLYWPYRLTRTRIQR